MDAKAIYNEETMVGFAMYGYSASDRRFELCRLMIDFRYQKQGFGKQALRLILEEMSRDERCSEIYLSCDPENRSAQKLYEAFGFRDTGRQADDEQLYVLNPIR